MKQISIIALFTILSLQTTFAQEWLYTEHIAPLTNSAIMGLTLDSDSNIYVTAWHRSDNDTTKFIGPFGTKNYLVSGVRRQEILIMKLDPYGDTIWSKTIGGTQSDYGRQVEVDKNNNPYIAGYFRSADLSIQESTLSNYDSYDIFLARYTADGANGFARMVAFGPGDDRVSQIAIDNDGNVYMAGQYTTELYFEKDTLYAVGSTVNLFLAKFKPNGDFRWARNIACNQATIDNTNFIEISLANDEEIYLGGFFYGTLTAGGIGITSQGAAEDILVMKVDSSGAVQWLRMGGSPDLADRCNGITSSTSGDIYITGYFQGDAKFDSTGRGLLNSSTISSAGGYDMFMAKYNSNGRLLWKTKNGSTGNDIAYGAKIRENILQFSGYFSGTLTFNNTVISSGSTSNEDTGFFIYDTDGNPITAKSIQGTGSERGEFIEYGLKGNTYVGGYFDSPTLTIGSTILTKRSVSGNNDAFIVKYHNPFSATFSVHTDISCPGGNDGELMVTSYFGTEPYNYDWSASTGTGTFENASATGLTAGYYEVGVTDSRDSVVIINYTLTEPDEFIILLDSTNLTCFESGNGSITDSVSGGTGTITYNWSGPGVTNPGDRYQSNLSAGLYRLTITDENNCEAYDSIEVLQPDPIYFGNVLVVPENPAGSRTGSIDLDVSGGTEPYDYAWDYEGSPLSGRISDTLNNLQEGTYTAYVSDLNLCPADTVIVVPGTILQVILSPTDISCYRANDGSAVALIAAGDMGFSYTYSFEDGLHNPVTPVNDSTIDGLAPGWYYVTVVEQGGDNRIAIDSAEIIEPEEIVFESIDITEPSCNGVQDGSIEISAGGGNGSPYQYSIDNGSNYLENSLFTGLPAQDYSIRIMDVNGCESADSLVTIDEPEGSVLVSSTVTNVSCYGYIDGSIVLDVTNPVGELQYSIDEGNTYLDNNGEFMDLPAGNYILQVIDGEECIKEFSAIEITQPDSISIDTTVSHASDDMFGEIEIIAAGGTQPYIYHIIGNSLNTSNLDGMFSNLLSDDYSVYVTDDNTCTSDTLAVTILQTSAGIIIYDAFSPNDDDRNEVWNIPNIELYPDCKVVIFNTWGNKVFSSDGYSEPWDGTYNNKDLPAGTYYYIIDLGDGSDPLSGPVSIVR